jgi:hypothetical protein
MPPRRRDEDEGYCVSLRSCAHSSQSHLAAKTLKPQDSAGILITVPAMDLVQFLQSSPGSGVCSSQGQHDYQEPGPSLPELLHIEAVFFPPPFHVSSSFLIASFNCFLISWVLWVAHSQCLPGH